MTSQEFRAVNIATSNAGRKMHPQKKHASFPHSFCFPSKGQTSIFVSWLFSPVKLLIIFTLFGIPHVRKPGLSSPTNSMHLAVDRCRHFEKPHSSQEVWKLPLQPYVLKHPYHGIISSGRMPRLTKTLLKGIMLIRKIVIKHG